MSVPEFWVRSLNPLLLSNAFLTPEINNFQEIYEIQTFRQNKLQTSRQNKLQTNLQKINFQNKTLTRVNKETFNKFTKKINLKREITPSEVRCVSRHLPMSPWAYANFILIGRIPRSPGTLIGGAVLCLVSCLFNLLDQYLCSEFSQTLAPK